MDMAHLLQLLALLHWLLPVRGVPAALAEDALPSGICCSMPPPLTEGDCLRMDPPSPRLPAVTCQPLNVAATAGDLPAK